MVDGQGLLGDEFSVPKKERKPRTEPALRNFARWFADRFISGGWDSLSESGQTSLMYQSKLVLTTGYKGYPPCPIELCKATLEAIAGGKFPAFRHSITSVFVVNWTDRDSPEPYRVRAERGEGVPKPPPIWQTGSYRKWYEKYGQVPQAREKYRLSIESWERGIQ